MKKQLYSTIALLVCLATAAHAALSVGPTGTGTLTFDTRPTIATGWSTLSSGASSTTAVTDNSSMDTYIAGVTAASITTELGSSTTYPPSTQNIARWNGNTTSGLFIQTRPTGNTVTLLMCTLVNDSGAAVAALDIAYDLGAHVSSDSTINESIWGHRVYWSLNGTTWTPIEAFSVTEPGHLATSIDLGGWAPGASLYLLWADDNGPSSDAAPQKEGAFSIDNFSATPGGGGELLVNLNHTTDFSAQRCSTVTITALATGGTRPYAYTWYKDGTPLGEPSTNPSLVINNAQETDNGAYFAVVTDSTPGAPGMTFSTSITLTITPDNAVPSLLSANSSGGNTVTVSFTKPIAISSAAGADFAITAVNGGAVLPIASAAVANGTNVVLTTASQLGGAKYQVAIQGSGVTDACNGSAVAGSMPILDHFIALALSDIWRYDTNAVDLGTAWREVSYPDDANWPQGPGVFDGKSTPRTTVGGQTVGTQLPLSNPNSTFGTAAIPTHYFRTHMSFPANADPAATLITFRAMFDDAIVVYVNGVQAYKSPLITNGVNDVFAAYTGATVGDASLSAAVAVDTSLFVDGDNVIAVILKQGNGTSSDSTMGLEITATVTNYYVGGVLAATASPASVSIAQCGNFTLTGATTGGTRPHTYQWYNGSTALTDGAGISGATTLHLTVNNAQPANAGNYRLRVTDATSATADSALVPVTVAADTAPALVSAVGQVDLHTLVVTFDKPVNISSATGGNFQVLTTEGGLSLTITSSVVNGAVVTLQTTEAREARNYNVVVGSGVTGACSGLAVGSTSLKIVSYWPIFGLNVNNSWQYNEAGVNLGTEWLNNSYDDVNTAGWAAGNALFAGDRDGVPATINGEPVNTTLAMTNSIFPTTGAVIPTYYFRKHFTPPTALANMTLACRTFFDDHGILYINGQEAYRNTNIVATNELFDTYLRGTVVGTANYSEIIPLPKDNVVQGDNVFAVYLKQGTPGSSDIAMGLELIAIVTDFAPVVTGPRLTITKNGNNATISWTPATGTLQECTALGAWGPSSVANGGSVPLTGNKFFRLAP